jgi:pimeloyl-ACP methyl ester carboxylesterase
LEDVSLSNDHRISRQAIIAGAAMLAPGAALAQTTPSQPPDAPVMTIWSKRYTALKGAVKLAVYRKRLGAPKAGEAARPVLVLSHGSSVAALATYDLHVPGAGEYSVMDVFSRLGYDVWTVDFENYGASARTDGTSDISSGSDDLKATCDVIQSETGAKVYHLFGESSGALRVALFASRYPERIGRLVLSAYTYTGEGSPTLASRAKDLEFYKTHNRRPRTQAMIDSIFTRDKPGTADPRVPAAMGLVELTYGMEVPTGSYYDMVAKLPIVEPAALTGPVMMIRGEYDGIATMTDLLAFYNKLPNGDRQFSVMPGMAHSVIWGINRQMFWHAMHAYLAAPNRSAPLSG